MDLTKFTREELILTALKSEVEAKKIYSILAEMVKNAFLKERLNFLAAEEEKHRQFFEELYKKEFPGKEISLPEKTPVPLPEMIITKETVPLTEVLEMAMRAEMAAYEFYNSLADLYKEEAGTENMLRYIASMEMGHYRLLEIERQQAQRFEDFDIAWSMIHIGP